MDETSRSGGFELAVTLFPVRYQVQADFVKDEPQAIFSSTMKKLGIKHHDPLPSLRERFKEDGENLFYDWCHYRVEGNAFIGEGLARFLSEEVI